MITNRQKKKPRSSSNIILFTIQKNTKNQIYVYRLDIPTKREKYFQFEYGRG